MGDWEGAECLQRLSQSSVQQTAILVDDSYQLQQEFDNRGIDRR